MFLCIFIVRGMSLREGEIMTLKMSLSILAKYIKNGFGFGRLDAYKPWLRIRRRFSSPVSKQVFCNLTLRATNHHLLSGLEYKVALVNSWLRPAELRECLPLWPDAHPHPQSGMLNDFNQRLEECPGLLEIARDAGIDHGVFPGTKVPYVATSDLVFWIPLEVPLAQQLVFISCKPLNEIKNRPRVRERLELERRYALINGGKHIIETGENLPGKLIDNLDWLLPLRSEVQELELSSRHTDFCALLMELTNSAPLGEAINQASEAFQILVAEGFKYFRVGVWLHKIDIDLNRPVVMSRMMQRDGGKALRQLRELYWPSTKDKK